MTALHSAAFILGVALGAFLGRHWALARSRNPMLWALAGAVLPLTVIVLWFLKPLPAPAEETAEEVGA